MKMNIASPILIVLTCTVRYFSLSASLTLGHMLFFFFPIKETIAVKLSGNIVIASHYLLQVVNDLKHTTSAAYRQLRSSALCVTT